MSDRICLIVDEDSNIRTYLRLILEERGINSLEAANASEALRVVQRPEGRLDFILTDILIPGDMSGIDLAHSVRQGFPTVPVILMSGYYCEPMVRSSGFPFIAKPFLPEKIWKVLEQVLSLNRKASASSA